MNRPLPPHRSFRRPKAAPPASPAAPAPSAGGNKSTPSKANTSSRFEDWLRSANRRIEASLPSGWRTVARCGWWIVAWSYFYLRDMRQVLEFSTAWLNWALPFPSPRGYQRAVRAGLRLVAAYAMLCVFGMIGNAIYDYFFPTVSASQLAERTACCRRLAQSLFDQQWDPNLAREQTIDDEFLLDLMAKKFARFERRASEFEEAAGEYDEALRYLHSEARHEGHNDAATNIAKRRLRLRVLLRNLREHTEKVPEYLEDLERLKGLLKFSQAPPAEDSVRRRLRDLHEQYLLLHSSLFRLVEFFDPTSCLSKGEVMSGQIVSLAFGLDLGTTFSEGAVCTGSAAPQPVSFPGDGELLESVVYMDGSEVAVGKAALTKAMKNPRGLYTHFKRLMATAPHEPLAGPGTPTPVDCTAAIIVYWWTMLQSTTPVCDYLPSKGGRMPAEQMQIVWTAPASAPIAYHQTLFGVAQDLDIPLSGVIAESVAACQTFRAATQGVVKNGHKLLVCDLGGGTFDLSCLQMRDGAFDQFATHGDDNLGAINLQRAVYREFCKQVGLERLADAIDPVTGLSAVHEGRDEADVRLVLELADKATEACKLLSVTESAELFANTHQGLLELSLDRNGFERVIDQDGSYDRFRNVVAKTIEKAGCKASDFEHVLFVGGPAPCWKLRHHLADVTQRSENEVFLPADSAHAVARGAALTAIMQENTGACLPRGLGYVVVDKRDPDNHRNKLVIPPGASLPPGGLSIEEMGQQVTPRGGEATLELTLFETKPGVEAASGNGQAVVMQDSEIVVIRRLRESVVLPAGDHEVCVGFLITPSNHLMGRLSFPDLPDVDVVTFDVTAGQNAGENTGGRIDAVFLIDTSSSVEHALDQIKESSYGFLEQLAPTDTRVGVVRFNSDSRILATPGDSLQAVADQIGALVARGSTAMALGLLDAAELLRAHGKADRQALTLLLTDGHPNDPEKTREAAELLKRQSQLVCIGFGGAVSDEYLQSLASTPSDYYFIDSVNELPRLFEDLLHLYFVNPSESS